MSRNFIAGMITYNIESRTSRKFDTDSDGDV